MYPTRFRLSSYQITLIIITPSCLWKRAATQESLWFNYPDCVIPCLEFYSLSVCDGVDNQCLCNSFEFQGAVAECGRFSCGGGDNNDDSTVEQIWQPMSYNCHQFPGIPIMGEQEFASSAGLAAGGNMPISTTATIIGSSTTFTVHPEDNLLTSTTGVTTSSGNVTTTTPTIIGQPTSFIVDPSGSSSSVSASLTSGGQVPATTSLNSPAAAATTTGGGGGSIHISILQICGIVGAVVGVATVILGCFACRYQKKTADKEKQDIKLQRMRMN